MNNSILIAAVSVLFLILIIQILIIIASQVRSKKAFEILLQEEFKTQREFLDRSFSNLRSELITGLSSSSETVARTITSISEIQRSQSNSIGQEIRYFTESNRAGSETLRTTIEKQLTNIREMNEKKLEDIRKIVDEKLTEALEKRLGQSFNLVSDRLEAVQRGLGEMQNLAAGVGDLKRVLTNVKTRGIWGEVQLGNILEQILTPEQYQINVRTKEHSTENVEFAIKLPGREADNKDSFVWLPVDSKFPLENYIRVLDYAENNDTAALQTARAELILSIKKMARDIRDKYISPPHTTDFGILFLPIEGLYAEVLRNPGLLEDLQQNYRIIIAGPATFSALLNSLKVGFRTLAIEKRAGEVWQLLSAVKVEFSRFGAILQKVKKQLNLAAKTIDDTDVRTRAMERKLHNIELSSEISQTDSFELPEISEIESSDLTE